MARLPSNSNMNRRDFLRTITALGGAAALASFLEGCSMAEIAQETLISPTGTPEIPPPTRKIASTSTPTQEEIMPTETNPAPSATSTEPASDGKARLAFVKTKDRAEGVRKAIELLGINRSEEHTSELQSPTNL